MKRRRLSAYVTTNSSTLFFSLNSCHCTMPACLDNLCFFFSSSFCKHNYTGFQKNKEISFHRETQKKQSHTNDLLFCEKKNHFIITRNQSEFNILKGWWEKKINMRWMCVSWGRSLSVLLAKNIYLMNCSIGFNFIAHHKPLPICNRSHIWRLFFFLHFFVCVWNQSYRSYVCCYFYLYMV